MDTALPRRRVAYACSSDSPAGADMLHGHCGNLASERARISICHLSWRVRPENREWRAVYPTREILPESPFSQAERKRAARSAERENDAQDQRKRILPRRVYTAVRGQGRVPDSDG